MLALDAGTVRKYQLRDGFVLAGIDGKLTGADANDVRFFEFDSEISDGKASVKAGSAIELLPSSALEKMTADAKERTSAGYRLWGEVTKYKGKNFIFPTYFLPLNKIEQQKSQQTQQPKPQSINDPNDVITIPDEVMKKLGGRRIIRTEQLEKGLLLKADSILADRIGFISSCICAKTNEQCNFILDALGRNAQRSSFRLLPCRMLELAQRQKANEPEPVRFKIAGIVTKYKGQNYLLLQRATRVYTHGNFGI
ncbi:MAG: hypothetical protein ACYS1A_09270 [Planctomycetota bacterium]